jgi:2,2-dialkylglycine decarboxylase (pyruvate)
VPVSGVIVSDAMAERLYERHYYQSSSHTGDPLTVAAGRVNLEIIQDEGLVENAGRVGEHLRLGLLELADTYEQIGDVRGRGLILGIEMVADRDSRSPAGKLAEEIGLECQRRGLLVGHIPGVVSEQYIRFLPPLNLTVGEADRALGILADSLEVLLGRRQVAVRS